MRFLMPLVLVIVAAGIFVAYTNPTYQEVKSLSAQSAQYDEALTQSSQLRRVRDQLLSESEAISTDNLRSLEHMLPNNVDNIRLIIDINDIAARNGLQVSNITVNGNQSDSSVGAQAGPVGSVELSFDVQASYAKFISFLNDLQHSLRIIDVESISFAADKNDMTKYTLKVQTYWLK